MPSDYNLQAKRMYRIPTTFYRKQTARRPIRVLLRLKRVIDGSETIRGRLYTPCQKFESHVVIQLAESYTAVVEVS